MTKTIEDYITARVSPARAVVYSSGNTEATALLENTEFTKYIFANAVIGEFKNIGQDIANKQSVIIKKGTYLIECTFSSRIDSVGVNLETCVLVNGIKQPNMHIKRYFVGVSYISTATLSGLVNLNKEDTISIGIKHDKAGTVNIITEFSSLLLLKV